MFLKLAVKKRNMTIFLNRLIENRSDVQLEQLIEKKIISEFLCFVYLFSILWQQQQRNYMIRQSQCHAIRCKYKNSIRFVLFFLFNHDGLRGLYFNQLFAFKLNRSFVWFVWLNKWKNREKTEAAHLNAWNTSQF